MLLDTSTVWRMSDFPLSGGARLDTLELAYETWGALAPDGNNAILLCHGYTNNPHAAGDKAGWWHNLIGPGCAIDTDKYFVVCINMLGSAFGSSGPATVNPATGQPFGPDFPAFAVSDIAQSQRRLLDHLGVAQLAAVIGYSYGGHLAFHWAHTFPDRVRAAVVVASAIKGRGDRSSVTALEQRFAQCAGWHGGHYYAGDPTASVAATLKAMRLETLRSYHVDESLRTQLGDAAAAARRLDELAQWWAGHFDANSLIVLRRAAVQFDAPPAVAMMRAPLLYVLASSDALFGPELAKPTMALLRDAGVAAEYFEIDSAFGHHAPVSDWAKWAPVLRDFLTRTTGL